MFKFNVYKGSQKVFTSNNCKDCNDYVSDKLEELGLTYQNSPYWIEDEGEEVENVRLKWENGI